MTEKETPSCTKKEYIIHQKDLPLSCPAKDMAVWNAHPQVYLPIEKTGREVCPYCGSVFVLEAG